MKKITPAAGWILAKKNIPAEKTAGGIILPQSARDRETGIQSSETPDCVVLEVGEGVTNCKPGDTVIIQAMADTIVGVVYEDTYTSTLVRGKAVANFYLVDSKAIVGTVTQETAV